MANETGKKMNEETNDNARLERGVIDPDFSRDILESDIPRDVLDILLKDMTTGRNIMWMTDNYLHLESTFDVKMGPNIGKWCNRQKRGIA